MSSVPCTKSHKSPKLDWSSVSALRIIIMRGPQLGRNHQLGTFYQCSVLCCRSRGRDLPGRIMAHKYHHILMITGCGYVTLSGKRDFADMIKANKPGSTVSTD
ncbi:uncharacterized protein LOC115281506 isoform X1 [Suricata suricatta]|uniref:uncharacterized protein LOC115281506 isoform X1 n=1 Tax=Suricata suricatta TaxID=37032 RepID=UPI001155A0A7|nr:uncharacterized protein LOC115281506 isoform X1 [Suricata suricatta]